MSLEDLLSGAVDGILRLEERIESQDTAIMLMHSRILALEKLTECPTCQRELCVWVVERQMRPDEDWQSGPLGVFHSEVSARSCAGIPLRGPLKVVTMANGVARRVRKYVPEGK